MPGFDGLAKLREESARKKRGDGATLDEMEEYYQEQRGKFSKAYFSGSSIYVGDSFKEWYLGSKKGKRDFGNALVFGAILCALVGKK